METYVDEPNSHPMARVDVATEPRRLNLKYILTQARTTHTFIALSYMAFLQRLTMPPSSPSHRILSCLDWSLETIIFDYLYQ